MRDKKEEAGRCSRGKKRRQGRKMRRRGCCCMKMKLGTSGMTLENFFGLLNFYV